MMVENDEVVSFRHEVSHIDRTGIESNGCKEICLNVNERRFLKRINSSANFRIAFFAKTVEGPSSPPPPVVKGPAFQILCKRAWVERFYHYCAHSKIIQNVAKCHSIFILFRVTNEESFSFIIWRPSYAHLLALLYHDRLSVNVVEKCRAIPQRLFF